VSPVKYKLGFYIPEVCILHTAVNVHVPETNSPNATESFVGR
jgi:hypothetical protein